MENGSRYADTFQDAQYSYMHHMRDGSANQSREEAEQLMNQYINRHLGESRCYMAQGNYESAFFHLGMALHPIMDSTAPSHGDFLPWYQSYPALFLGVHVVREISINDIQLQETVERMLRIYQ